MVREGAGVGVKGVGVGLGVGLGWGGVGGGVGGRVMPAAAAAAAVMWRRATRRYELPWALDHPCGALGEGGGHRSPADRCMTPLGAHYASWGMFMMVHDRQGFVSFEYYGTLWALSHPRGGGCPLRHPQRMPPPLIICCPCLFLPLVLCRIALYIPSASALTRGGFFYPRAGSNPTTYDTLISAQHILKSMADNHAPQLAQLQLQLDASKQLMGTQAASPAAAAAAAAAAGAVEAAGGEGKKAKKGSEKGAAGGGSIEGSLMQLVAAGLSTDDDVSGRVCGEGGGL